MTERAIVRNVLPYAEKEVRKHMPRLWNDMEECTPLRDLYEKALWEDAHNVLAKQPVGIDDKRAWFAYYLLANAVGAALKLNSAVKLCEPRKGDACCVCLDAFCDEIPALRLVRCGHVMHAFCICAWMAGAACTCPQCRDAIPL